MRTRLYVLVIAFAAALAACDTGPKSARGFRLPDGDVAAGKAAFVDLQCYECHVVPGVDLPSPATEREIEVVLGGKVRRIQTYGELVTSIINPSHKLAKGYLKDQISTDGKSKMKILNDTMTVRQLTDLVAFLQAQYDIEIDENLFYPYGP